MALRIRTKIKSSHPGSMFLAYAHNEEKQWQQVSIANQKSVFGCVTFHKLFTARRKIALPKFNDQ